MADVLPPHSVEAEEATLGSLLIDPTATTRASAVLLPEDFYIVKNGWIYQAVLALGEKADLLTVSAELASKNLLEEVGGESYLAQLTASVPTALNVETYARIVADLSLRRRLITSAGDIARLAYDQAQPVDQVIEKSEASLFAVSDQRLSGQMVPIRKAVDEFFERVEYLHEHKDEPLGIPTGYPDLDKLTGGLQKGDLIIIAARPGVGKCVTADTQIVDPATGELVCIEQRVREHRANLLTLGGDYRLRAACASDFVDDGIKPVYRVVTGLGREIKVTLSHPFLTPSGWKSLAELGVGDTIGVPGVIPVFGSDDVPAHQIKALADLMADGCTMGHDLQFTNSSASLRQGLAEAALAFPGATVREPDSAGRSAPAAGVLDRMCDAPGVQFIPRLIFRATRECAALFLNRLFACDGSIYFQDGHPRVSYSTLSPALARGVQHLLLRFGIVARLGFRFVKYKGRHTDTYELVITDAADVKTFCESIGACGKEEHIAQALKSLPLAQLAQSDVYWDRIERIDYAGERQVYDLAVPGTHNFIADDVIVHNTSLMLNMGYHAAFRHRQRVAIFSLEMSNEQLVQRFVASETGIDSQRLRIGDLKDEEWAGMTKVCMQMHDLYIFLDDTPSLTPLDLRVKARRIYQEYGLDLIIVDYLQLMQGETASRNENRVQEISYISRALKGISRELKVPLVAGSQLSRMVEQRSDKRPMLSDLRESGSIEQDSDIVMFIYRDEIYNPDTEFKNIAEISVAKNRNGPTGKATLYFDKRLTSFKNLAKEKIQL